MLIVDAEDRICAVNQAAEALAGASRERLTGRPLRALLRPVAGGANMVARPDGARIATRVSLSELPEGRKLLIASDVSDRAEVDQASAPGGTRLRRQAGAEALRAAETIRQLQHFWLGSRDLLAILAPATCQPLLLNDAAWTATLGYPSERLYATDLLGLVHPDDRDRTLALRRTLSATSDVHGFRNRLRRSDGRWTWLSWNVVSDGELDYAIARDVTEEVEAREALSQSERQFRLLVAGVVDYALFMLSPEGVVTNWNAGAQHIKGYAASEILGEHFSRFYTERDRAAGLPDRALKAAAEHGRYEAEGWRVRKDGSLFWANAIIDAIYDETGQLIGFAKITRDMTERREAQLELQRTQERLAQAQKLEAIGQLTGGVAHDFNNLLMVIGGQTQLIRRRLGDERAVGKALDAIDLSTRRGADLTRHLLAFARRQRLHPSRVDLRDRTGALQQLLSASVGSKARVEIAFPAELWAVRVDASELELALLNMAVNARDAMPSGGALRLAGRNVTLAGGELDENAAGEFVCLTLTDSGSGIAPDILPKVFEPFFTTKDVDRGTGLGLSQVYGLVQQSGGRIRIESELGKGTEITLYLPRAGDETEPAPAEPAAPATADAGHPAYVLLVEDNPQVGEVAAQLLEQLGHRTRTAVDAASALALLEGGERPDLLFTDVVMAGEMNGLDLAREVRRRWPEIPVLIATGYSEAAERMPKGEFPVLAKPYGVAELERALGVSLVRRGAVTPCRA